MCVYVLYVYMCIYICVYISVCVYMHVGIHMCICVHICTLYTYMYTHVYMYMCIYVCCVCVYLQSIFKYIKCVCITVNPKGNEPCIFTGRTDAEAQAPILWPLDANSWLTGKDPDAGKGWRQKKRATEDKMVGWHHRYVHGHELGQTLGEGEGQGKPGGLPCMGLQRSQTWLGNWTTIKKYTYRHTLEWRLKYILIMYSKVITPFLLSGKQWNSKKKLLRKLTKRNKWLDSHSVLLPVSLLAKEKKRCWEYNLSLWGDKNIVHRSRTEDRTGPEATGAGNKGLSSRLQQMRDTATKRQVEVGGEGREGS